MNILIFIPHDTLLGPQGALHRLRGLTTSLANHKIVYLVPNSVPAADTTAFGSAKVYTYAEPGILGKKIPYLLDYRKSWLKSFDDAVDTEQIALAIFVFPWGLAAAAARRKLPAVYYSNGVEHDFTDITLRHLGLSALPIGDLLRRFIGALERRACDSAAAIITMSGRDSERYQELYGIPKHKLFAFPQPMLSSGGMPAVKLPRSTWGLNDQQLLIVFHGSWQHLPNREAITAIREKIASEITKSYPQCHFIIAGSGVPQFEEPGVTGLGFVENLPALLSVCDVAAVPVFSGAGVRMKLFDYFQSGIPCVSTRKGAEGLDLTDGKEILFSSDDCAHFTIKLTELISNAELRATISRSASDYIKSSHDPATVAHDLNELLNSLVLH